MTKYKKVLKALGYRFNEDYDYLPYEVEGGVCLEDASVLVTPEGLFLSNSYNVDVWHYLLGRDLQPIPILEENDRIVKQDFEVGSVRIFNDFPRFHFVYDMNDKLRYMYISDSL